MRKHIFAGVAIAVIAAVGLGLAGQAAAQPGPGYGPGMMGGGGGWGPGMMGPGMMGGGGGWGPGMMGPGMMGGGGGWGPGSGGCGQQQQADLNLTVDQVKSKMAQWIAAAGNPHVKLGTVTEKNADTITVDVVTADKGDLVEVYDINRHTGYMQPAQN